jgi:hypothetical protein
MPLNTTQVAPATPILTGRQSAPVAAIERSVLPTPKGDDHATLASRPREQRPQPVFVKQRYAQLPRLVQLAAGILSGDDIARLLGH